MEHSRSQIKEGKIQHVEFSPLLFEQKGVSILL